MVGDGLYRVQGWTKLTKGTTKEQYDSIELWLRWKVKGAEEDSKLLGVRGKFLKSMGITFFSVQKLQIIEILYIGFFQKKFTHEGIP